MQHGQRDRIAFISTIYLDVFALDGCVGDPKMLQGSQDSDAASVEKAAVMGKNMRRGGQGPDLGASDQAESFSRESGGTTERDFE